MKLVNTAKDPIGVDPRSKNSPRPAADTSSNDNNSPPFEGVLSDVGSDTKTVDAGTKSAASATSVAPPVIVDAASAGSTILDAISELLGAGASVPGTQTTADTKGETTARVADPSSDAGDAVDSLLKRMASKDTAAADPQTPAANVSPTNPPADMMSMLLLGAKVAPQAAPAAAGPAKGAPIIVAATTTQATTKPKSATVGPAVAAATTAASDPSLSTDATTAANDPSLSIGSTKDMIVTDVAVSTHLAPAQTAPTNVLSSGDAKPTAVTPTALVSSSAAPANAAHAKGEDLAAVARGTDAAASPVTLTPTTTMGASPTPVRSIAAAIGELAAPAAPATAVPDAPKAALGIARTMTLQMNPADLGTVDIRLHVTGQTLDVQLTVSNTQTLGIVNRDRDTLTSALQDQSYTVNSLVIQDGGAAASSGGNNAATQGDNSGSNARADRQSFTGGAGSGAQGGGGGGRQGGSSGADRPPQDTRRNTSGDTPARPGVEPRNGSLYV